MEKTDRVRLPLWHGTNQLYETPNLSRFRMGEGGCEAGRGYYTDVSPKGASVYADMIKSKGDGGYLYQLEYDLSPSEVLHIENPLEMQNRHLQTKLKGAFDVGGYYPHPRPIYLQMQRDMGIDGAANQLISLGVRAIFSSVSKDKECGQVIVILDPSEVQVVRRFKMRDTRYLWQCVDAPGTPLVSLDDLILSTKSALPVDFFKRD